MGTVGTIGHGTQLPINVWIDSFEPGHSQNHLMAAKGGDEESFLMLHSRNRELERSNTICMEKLFSICNGNIHGGAGFSDETQSAN